MTIPAWPTDLPSCPIMDSLRINQTADGPIRTDMNAGTTRARRRVSLRIAQMSLSLRMTSAQVTTFKTFHEQTLGDGAARFTMPVLFVGGKVTRTVQFADQPSYQMLGGGRWRIDLSLRVEAL